jgi:hypothetical protein
MNTATYSSSKMMMISGIRGLTLGHEIWPRNFSVFIMDSLCLSEQTKSKHLPVKLKVSCYFFNPYPANADNMASSFQC